MSKHELLITLGMQDATFQQKIKAVNRQLKITDKNFEILKTSTKNFGDSQKDLAREMSYLEKKIKETNTNFKTYKERINEMNNTIQKSEEKHKKLTERLSKEKQELENLAKTQGKSSNAYKEQKEKVKQTQQEIDKLDRTIVTHRNSLQTAMLGYRNTKLELVNLNNALKIAKANFATFNISKVANDFDRLGTSMSKVGKSMQTVGKNLTSYVSAPMAMVGGVATKTFIDFEEQVRRTNALIDKGAMDQKESYDAIMDKSRELGRTTIFTAQEVAQGMEYMALAGWDTEQSLTAINSVLDLSAIGMTDLATASDIVTDAMTPLKMEAKDTGHFVDVMSATITRSNTDIVKLGESFKYATPVAGNLGINIEDLSIALGLMANSGIKASSAGTSFATGMARLVNPTEKASKAMKEYGVAVQYDAKTGSVDLMATMENLRETLGGLSKKTRQQAIDTIFGKTAMKGWSAVIGATSEDFESLKNAIEGADGATASMLEQIEQSGAFSFKLMSSAINDLLISLGELLAPAITDMANAIANISSKLSIWIQGLKQANPILFKLISYMSLFAVVIGPVLLVFGSLTMAVGACFKGVSKFLKLFLPDKNGDPSKLLTNIQKGFTNIKNVAQKAFNTVKLGGTKAFNAIRTGASSFFTFVTPGLNLVKNALIGNIFSWGDLGRAISNMAKGAVNNIKSVFSAVWNFDKTIAKAFGAIKNSLKSMVTSARLYMAGFMDMFTGSKIGGAIMKAMSSLGNILTKGLKTILFGSYTDKIADMMIKPFVNAFQVLERVSMKYIMLFLDNPKMLFKTLMTDLLGMVTKFKGTLVGLFTSLPSIISSGFKTLVSSITGFIPQIFGVILRVIKNPIGLIRTAIVTFGPMIAGAFASVVATLGGGLATIGGAMVAIFNPITIGVVLIGALIASFVHLYKTSDEFRGRVSVAFETLKNKLIELKDTLFEFGDKLKEVFENMKKEFAPTMKQLKTETGKTVEELKKKVKELAKDFKEGFDKVIETAKNFIKDVARVLQENFPDIGANIMSIFSGIWGLIIDAVSGFLDILITTFTGVMEIFMALMDGDFQKVGELLMTLMGDILSAIISFILGAFGHIWSILKGILPILAGIVKTVLQVVGGLILGAITGILGWIAGKASEFLGKVATFFSNMITKVVEFFTNLGPNIVTGIENIKQWFIGLKDSIVQSITTWVNDTFTKIGNWCSNVLSTIAGWASDALKPIADWCSNALKSVATFISDSIKNIVTWISEFISKLIQFGADCVTAVGTALRGVVDAIVKPFKDAYLGVKEWWDNIKEMVKNPIKAVVETIKRPGKASIDEPLGPPAPSFPEVTRNIGYNMAKTPDMNNFKTTGGFYSPLSVQVKEKKNPVKDNDDTTKELVSMLKQQNEILMQLLMSTQNPQPVEVGVSLDGRQIAKASSRYMEQEMNAYAQKRNRLGGK